MRPAPSGLRTLLWRATRVKLVLFVVVAAWIIGSAVGLAARGAVSVSDGDVLAGGATEPGSVSALVRAHDCWTGSAPDDVSVPGHVVAGRGAGPVYGGARMVHLALDQVFAGTPHGLTVYAFCR
ncbi:hypothetical protein [Nocardioides terrisoli]|uniref:hypothetical protein n=1 Tax=Nocardioides terrisoli TaxID=3388267 RepID=UPI00287B8D20|nr:hypothetical protein [Nocardioides marmorisolisilvae]